MAAQSQETSVEKTPPAEAKVKYEFPGLKDLPSMPIEYKGLTYDLKTITDEQAEMLISEKFPHIAKAK